LIGDEGDGGPYPSIRPAVFVRPQGGEETTDDRESTSIVTVTVHRTMILAERAVFFLLPLQAPRAATHDIRLKSMNDGHVAGRASVRGVVRRKTDHVVQGVVAAFKA
jgi:hypothetical protein